MIDIKIDKKPQPTIKDLFRQIYSLEHSEAVMIAQREAKVRADLEDRIEYLRRLEYRGKEIIDAGVDAEFLRSMSSGLTDFGC